MPIVAKLATPGLWCDTSAKLSDAAALQIRDAGFVGIGRYVRFAGRVGSAMDIDQVELERLSKVGLEVILFQHVRSPGWSPSDHSAISDAMAGVDAARAAGYPATAHICADAEGIGVGTMAGEVSGYYDVWGQQVIAEDYGAMLYLGYGAILSPQQAWLLHSIDRYATDTGDRDVANRGTCYQQTVLDVPFAGIKIDRAVMRPDRFGDVPFVAAWEPDAVT